MSNRNGQQRPAAPQEPQPVPAKELTLRTLLGYTDAQLRVTDPLVMNLQVAKEIPSLSNLDIRAYARKADEWAGEIKRGLRDAEREFHEKPYHWKNDLAFFRLGYLCYFVDEKLKIGYREDQKNVQSVTYTDASDLFLNGVMDTRKGTCGNMAAMHVALGWRLRWPVSLACVGAHLICRYDDGKVTHNIEATRTGGGGFHSHPDDYYLEEYKLPAKAVDCGSDLRALTPMEMLGVFIGFRARHYDNTGKHVLGEVDYLLARSLFPRNRHLHFAQLMSSIQNGMDMFEPWERGHPVETALWLKDVVRMAQRERGHQVQERETDHADEILGRPSLQSPEEREFRYDMSGRVNS